MPAGRPTKYRPAIAKKCRAYFAGGYKDLGHAWPTKAGFGLTVDISDETLNEWTKKYPEFSAAYKFAEREQQQRMVNGGLKGEFNASFAIFTAKNVLGWRDKQPDEEQKSLNINVGVVILPAETAIQALPPQQGEVIDIAPINTEQKANG